MAKAVFMTRIDTKYDDLPEIRYHFPHTYLNQAKQAEGDWILYYEPGSTGRRAYFATAFLEEIIEDTETADHFYAIMRGYFEFLDPVPFKTDEGTFESALLKSDGTVNKGLFGRSIHLIPDNEYLSILMAGTGSFCAALQTEIENTIDQAAEGVPALLAASSRGTFREHAFQLLVTRSYRATCAFSGIRLVNGGGATEVEAAHIEPIDRGGPDSPRNGVALSRTMHWAFDRGLVSMEDNGKILVAKRLLPEQMNRLIVPDGLARLPEAQTLQPHSMFLRYHRENIFKG